MSYEYNIDYQASYWYNTMHWGEKMNLIELKEEIAHLYKNFEFDKAIVCIEKYINSENAGIYGSLIYMYTMCLIKTGRLEEASACLDITRRTWPYIYTDVQLVEMYIMCDRIDKSEEILRKSPVDASLYFFSARSYMLFEHISLAKYWYERCIRVTDNNFFVESSKKYLKEIDNYIYSYEFLPISYMKYKRDYGKLLPGHIFYQNSRIEESEDTKSQTRPYMAWKIVDDKVYCFPVCSRKEKHEFNYILKKEVYPNYDFDRVINDHICCIDEKRIEKIIDKVKPYDYKRILYRLYTVFCHRNQKDDQGFFFDILNNLDICIDDTICTCDAESKTKNYYIVTGVNEDSYSVNKLIKNEDGTIERINEELSINKMDYIVKIYNPLPSVKQLKLRGEHIE